MRLGPAVLAIGRHGVRRALRPASIAGSVMKYTSHRISTAAARASLHTYDQSLLVQTRGLKSWVHALWNPQDFVVESNTDDDSNSLEATDSGDKIGEEEEEVDEEELLLSFEKVEEIDLDECVFGAPPRLDLVHRVVVWQRREWWQGTASAKGRAAVRGGGKKPWRQKGTGRARVSSIRNPIWRGGGVVHGPKPRDHKIKIQNKVKSAALRVAMSVRYAQGDLIIVKDLDLPTYKSRHLLNALNSIDETEYKTYKFLIVDGDVASENLVNAAKNIPKALVVPQQDISVYEIMKRDKLIISMSAYDKLVERLDTTKPPIVAVNVPESIQEA